MLRNYDYFMIGSEVIMAGRSKTVSVLLIDDSKKKWSSILRAVKDLQWAH